MIDPSPLFALHEVTLERSGRPILSRITWSVALGDYWALLGRNGSGKSTLLQLAIGRLWPTSGAVERHGRERIDLPSFWRRIGWITDDFASWIPPTERSLETVLSGRFAQFGLKQFHDDSPTPSDWERAEAALVAVGCGELRDRPFGVLSHGERRKVLVARARVAEALCLVLDEPCDGMDPGAREQFLRWLGEYLRGPCHPARAAVILVTHHIEEILPEFTRTLILRDGRIMACGPTEELLAPETIEQLYGVRLKRLERHAGRVWPIWD
ncbi:MAG: ATP-binding cassette domain-containing protein [Planctomycetes bacterium]|nr:ATP-binding cassette domain-containing protein [Planctomycetota bacterium]